jgi:hypothetical protein
MSARPTPALGPFLLLAMLASACAETRVLSVKEDGYVFSRRGIYVLVQEPERYQQLTRGLDVALDQAFHQARLPATVRYNDHLALRPIGLEDLRTADATAYALVVQVDQISMTSSGSFLDGGGATDRLVYSAELYDLGTRKKVWKALIDMADYSGLRRDSLYPEYCKALIARARKDGALP